MVNRRVSSLIILGAAVFILTASGTAWATLYTRSFGSDNGVTVVRSNNLNNSVLSPEELSSMTVSNLTTFNRAQITLLTVEQILQVRASQLMYMPPQLMRYFSVKQLALLTPDQAAGLTALHLRVMNEAQLASLSNAVVSSLTPEQLSGLSTLQLAALLGS